MKKPLFDFNVYAGTNLYLQTASDHFGNQVSTAILSCGFTKDDGASRVKKLANYIGSVPRPKPVNWSNVMNRVELFDESYKDEQAGDLLRDDCNIVSTIDMKGGFLFGGLDNMKFMHEPSLKISRNHDAKSKWNRGVVVLTCKYKDNHQCKVEAHKDSIEHLETIQTIIAKTFLREEIKKWNDDVSEKGRFILYKTGELLKALDHPSTT